MKILFDQGTPVPLREHLPNHVVRTAFEQGWSDLSNGELLDKSEQEGFEVLVTTDKNLRHQQSLAARKLAIIVLHTTSWPLIQLRIKDIHAELDAISPGEYREIPI
jgi:predicted nuclease of predicted toxin-antitoxin system